MDGGPTLKAKVVSSLNLLDSHSPRRHNIPSRPASPTKPLLNANSNVDSSSTFRPKAKVNSTATTRKLATAKASTSTSSTPRSRSPAKVTPRVRNGVTSPTHTPKAPSYGTTLRSPTTMTSPPITPERSSSLMTAASSSITPSDDATNSRLGTLHHALSFSSLQPTPNYSTPHKPGTVSATSSPRIIPLGALDRELTSSPTPMARIRSKVSAVAKVADTSTGASPPGLISSSPSTRSLHLRARTPSVSSTLSQQQQPPTNPAPQFYPITTATPAANPHRYASARPPPSRMFFPTASHVFQSNASSLLSADGSPPSQFYGIKADSAPPLSPPMSAVSFSSRSSLSRSSASVDERSGSQSTSTASSHLSPSNTSMRNGKVDLNATLTSLLEYTSSLPESAGEKDDEEHKVKAAAKSNRKIADLEITNRSLLAINATLEATKHRQAKEIRELKRKLRESRLILPPPAYRAVKSSLDPSEIADDEEDAEDEEQEGEDDKDEGYQRIRLLINSLLESGKRALEKQVKDFPESGKGGAKVLTAEEVRDWHHQGSSDDLFDHDSFHEEQHDQRESVSEFQYDTSADEGDRSFTESEAEVEAMTLLPISSSPPPIFITKPSRSFLLYS